MKTYLSMLAALLCVIFCGPLRAQQELDADGQELSEKWVQGPALVYDCDERHWVCVTGDKHGQCREQHDARLASKAPFLGCVPGTVFATPAECFARQRELIVLSVFPRACIHPGERARFIGSR